MDVKKCQYSTQIKSQTAFKGYVGNVDGAIANIPGVKHFCDVLVKDIGNERTCFLLSLDEQQRILMRCFDNNNTNKTVLRKVLNFISPPPEPRKGLHFITLEDQAKAKAVSRRGGKSFDERLADMLNCMGRDAYKKHLVSNNDGRLVSPIKWIDVDEAEAYYGNINYV